MLHPDLFAGLAERPTDLLRLVAIPAFAWASWQDVQIRRVPNRLWPPLAILGLALLLVDARYYHALGGFQWRLFAIGTAISIGLVVPLVYGFWLLGGFGGADVKAIATLAVLFPTYPTYYLSFTALPLVQTPASAFTLTILTNAVVVGLCYPAALAAVNVARGERTPWMFVGLRRRWDELERAHGRLLEDDDGFTRTGLDVDALRMYLRWRGIDLAELRERADELRDPASLPAEPNPPTDGAVATDGGSAADAGEPAAETAAETASAEADAAAEGEDALDDPWGAEAFLDDVEGSAYGTTPAKLRGGLEVVARRERVWLSPGIPFIVPVFVGLLLALTYGDLLFGLLQWLGFG